MKKLRLSKTSRTNFLTYGMVIVLFVVLQLMASGGMMSSSLKGQLVPICAYVVMALSLNLTVGILGELSLGHAGFMSVGAFAGAVAASAMQNAIPSAPLRLATVLGSVTGIAAIFYLIWVILEKLIWGIDVPGYATIIVLILFFSCIQLFCIGIIGEYVGRTFEQTKERPVYIAKEVLDYET